MKFPYPELTTVSHDNIRWYDCPNGFYPSITSILGATEVAEKRESLQNWRDSLGHSKADELTKRASDRGTAVHLLAERYLKKLPLEAPIDGKPVSNSDMESFNALRLKLKKVTDVWGQEVALFSESLEVAGRCDLIGVYEGVPCIIDFKTSTRVKKRQDINNYELQLAFYGLAHNEMFGTKIDCGIILMVAESGFPMEFKVNLPEHYESLKERAKRFWQFTLNRINSEQETQ